jgi:hypothetical protein
LYRYAVPCDVQSHLGYVATFQFPATDVLLEILEPE